MPIIAGNRLWCIKSFTVPSSGSLLVEHTLVCNPELGFAITDMWIIPLPPFPASGPGWAAIDIGPITDTTVEFVNTTSGEGGTEITINVLFVMPHSIIGPGDSGGYSR